MRTSGSSEVPFRNYTPRWPSTEPAKTFKIILTRALTNFAKTLSQKRFRKSCSSKKKTVALTGLAISRKIGNLRTTRATVDFAPLVCYLLRRLVKACRQARAVLTKTAKTPEIYKKAQRSGGSNLCRPKISRPWATPSRRRSRSLFSSRPLSASKASPCRTEIQRPGPNRRTAPRRSCARSTAS